MLTDSAFLPFPPTRSLNLLFFVVVVVVSVPISGICEFSKAARDSERFQAHSLLSLGS